MSYNFNTAIAAIDSRIQSLASSATGKDAVYLGKAIEALVVPSTVAEIVSTGDTKVTAINTAGTTNVASVNTAGTTQVANVNTAGTTQVAAVNAAAANYSLHPAPSTTAVSKTIVDNEFCLVTASGKTITLPASPTAGNSVVYIAVGNFIDTVLGRNGNKIMGLAEDMTIDKASTVVTCMFHSTNEGWRVF